VHTLDVIYWACLFLGAAYFTLTLAVSGISHVVSSIEGALDATGGHGAGVHVDGAGVGHADVGHVDAGHAHFDHGDMGHFDTSHGEVDGSGHVAHEGGADMGQEAGHAADGHATGDSHAEHGHHHGGDHHVFNPWAFLNPTMVSSFLIGFGGAGVLSRGTGAGSLVSIACAGVTGSLLFSYTRWIIVRLFGGAQASSHTRTAQLVGLRGVAITPIAPDRPGMIALTIGGSRQTFRALAEDAETISTGTEICIRRVERDKVWVTRLPNLRRDFATTPEAHVQERLANEPEREK